MFRAFNLARTLSRCACPIEILNVQMTATKSISENPAWQSLIQRLQDLKSFRIHTGNINNYVELKLKRFHNSAEELIACLDLQFADLAVDIDVT